MKIKNKFVVIFAKYRHFTVYPNIDPDPKTDPYFDLNIFVFVLLNVILLSPRYNMLGGNPNILGGNPNVLSYCSVMLCAGCTLFSEVNVLSGSLVVMFSS
jgi:hypothetical protein